MASFWEDCSRLEFSSEGDVEAKFVYPLLAALGYKVSDIVNKVPVIFQTGKTGRKHEADVVVYAARPHDVNSSLLVVEAKGPEIELSNGKAQAESYSANLKTPFYLLTNGKLTELWQIQPAAQSERLFAVDTSAIFENRGLFERYLARPAAEEYMRRLKRPSVHQLSQSFTDYEAALDERLDTRPLFLPRQLILNDANKISSEVLLAHFPKGCLVVAPSGYGKTALSSHLLKLALTRRTSPENAPLPIEVFLPDLIGTGQPLMEFVSARVKPHSAQASPAVMQDMAKAEGLLLVCDGLDRIDQQKRPQLEAELRTFLSDYPRSQAVVFTGPGLLTKLPLLGKVEIGGLSDQEQSEIISESLRKSSAYFYRARGELSPLMREICMVPIALSLAIQARLTTGRFPSDLAGLFDAWLAAMLDHEDTAAGRFETEFFLRAVARETRSGPISIIRVKQLAKENSLGANAVDVLVGRGALLQRGQQFELQHEAIADYLRALELSEAAPDVLRAKLEHLTFSPTSFLPALLMSVAKTSEAQALIWTKIVSLGIPHACRAVLYRAQTIELSGDLKRYELSMAVLKDIYAGLVEPLIVHFKPVKDHVTRHLSGKLATGVKIIGDISEDRKWVHFGVLPRLEDDMEFVRVTKPPHDEAHIRFGINLQKSGFRIDAGRILGMRRLADSLVDCIKTRRLSGGRIWIEERVFGRVRHLLQRRFISWQWADGLVSLKKILEGKSQYAFGSISGYEQSFKVTDLISDLDWLLERECKVLTPWWASINRLELDRIDHRQVLSSVLDSYHRRAQIAYAEVFELNFQANMLPYRQSLPAKYNYFIETAGQVMQHGIWGLWTQMPVDSFDTSGAEVSYLEGNIPKFNWEAYVKEVDEVYSRLDRPSPPAKYRYSLVRGRVHDVSHGGPGGLRDETSVTAFVCKTLEDEIRGLFSELPSSD